MTAVKTGYSSRYQWIPETGATVSPSGVVGSGDPPNPRGYVGNHVQIQIRLQLEATILANTVCDFSAIYPTEFFNPGPANYWVRILKFSRPANKFSTDKTFLIIDNVEIFSGEALSLVNPQSVGSSFFMEIRRNGVFPLDASGDAIWSTTGVTLPSGQIPLMCIPGTMEPTAVPLAIGGDLRSFELAIKVRNEDIANDITGFAGNPPVLLINIIGHEVVNFAALPLGALDAQLSPVHDPLLALRGSDPGRWDGCAA